jgi:GSCFA family
MRSPYENRDPKSFWRSGVSETNPLTIGDLYEKKFEIAAGDKIATAGSCFAQHVARHMRASGFQVLDVEPAPAALSEETAKLFGYGIYSARYGNIYSARQLLQLAQDAHAGSVEPADVWTKDGRFYDALRPNIEPNGFESLEEALALRREHLDKVQELFKQTNVLVFTFGLTEAWMDKNTGRVFPTAPGTIAGVYDPDVHVFKNFSYNEVYDDFVAFRELVRGWNPTLRILLTVSPVPLTATATDHHVLVATTYSKSVLRAVAGDLAANHDDIDYFPSYEMVASPWSRGFFYENNLREVSNAGVETVMRVFFSQHRPPAGGNAVAPVAPVEDRAERRERRRKEKEQRKGRRDEAGEDDAVCEDVLLEAFGS